MPLVWSNDNAAVHIKAVYLKGCVKCVEQRCMIGIAKILSVQLPIIVDDLALYTERFKLTPKVPAYEVRHRFPKKILD